MFKRFSILAFFLCGFLVGYSQNLSVPKIEKVLLDKTDSTKNNYTIVYPTNVPYKGLVFLVPGFGENAEAVFLQTDLPLKLAAKGIVTVIPTFHDGVLSFGVDSLSQSTFESIVNDVVAKNKLQNMPVYVGGFSIGGSAAIKFAENARVKPKAVFAIDPPLDFERFYNNAVRDVRLSQPTSASQENIYMIQRIEAEAGGTPTTHLKNYYALSPYSFTDTTQTAIKKLVQTPIRIYSEPDINWWLNQRRADLTGMNVTDAAAMTNELRRLGNDNAN